MGRLIVAGIATVVMAQGLTSSRSAPAFEQMLPMSTYCWEPAIAAGPRNEIYIVAGHRTAPGAKEFDQKQVLWRSLDGGMTFEDPRTVSADGHREADQRIAVDGDGTVYVSFMDHDNLDPGAPTRLRLARSRDEGRTFSVDTIPVSHVSDKPELAVSSDGRRIAVVYESSSGPSIVTTADGGTTWNDARLVEPSNGRHFWPEALTFAPDGALWFAVPSMSDADIAKRQQTDVQLHVYRSIDDGQHWEDSRVSTSPRFLGGCAHDSECRVKLPDISVAIDDDGKAYAAYTEGSGPGHSYALLVTSSVDAGRTWSTGRVVSAAPRAQSNDVADHDYASIAAKGHGQVCVVWVDDRRGVHNVFARCSTDGAKTWGDDIWLSNRTDGAPYKSPLGFAGFYGHYGGAVLSSSGRLFAVWAEGERDNRTGTVWFNRMPVTPFD